MSNPDEIEDIDYHVYITGSTIRNNYNDFLKPYNLYTEQYGVLCSLNEMGTLTLSQLAEQLYKDKTTITRLIDSLVKKEFIKKEPSQTDRRAFDVSMTQKGIDLYAEIGVCLKLVKAKMEEMIDPKEKEITIKVLKQIREMSIIEEVNNIKKEEAC